jgi:hypothetical protein
MKEPVSVTEIVQNTLCPWSTLFRKGEILRMSEKT